MAEREGFEPPNPCGLPDFESGAFDHSAISPPRIIAQPRCTTTRRAAWRRVVGDTGSKRGGMSRPFRTARADRYFFAAIGAAGAFAAAGGVAGADASCGAGTVLPAAFISAW